MEKLLKVSFFVLAGAEAVFAATVLGMLLVLGATPLVVKLSTIIALSGMFVGFGLLFLFVYGVLED